tara:strand:- start:1 stop:702 length:702 start_codon:yes stop_codon:yes gene_type:complete
MTVKSKLAKAVGGGSSKAIDISNKVISILKKNPTLKPIVKKRKLSRVENIKLGSIANKNNIEKAVLKSEANKLLKKFGGTLPVPTKKPFKLKKPNPKPKNNPGNVAPKNKREVKRLQKQQELDDANMLSERRKEMMTKEQYLESNPVERKAGAGSGPSVSGSIMRGKGVTRDQAKEIEEMAAEGKGFQIKKYGGKVKRNMGGPAKPRKKTVFRRGGGQALRGFGKATYSNKMY